MCVSAPREAGGPVSRGQLSPGTPLNDSSDLLPSSVVGMRSGGPRREVRGRLTQHGVNT